MTDILTQHTNMLLPEDKMQEYTSKLADQLAIVISKNPQFNFLVADWQDLSLSDMLLAAMIVNDGVVIFTPVSDNSEINATFVAINEVTETQTLCMEASKSQNSKVESESDDDFEKQLAAIEISDKLPESPRSPTIDTLFETECHD